MTATTTTTLPTNRAGEPILLVERHDHVAVVRINRPEARNAINADLAAALDVTWAELEADDDIRVYVITGNDDKAFSAGADLKDVAANKFPDGSSPDDPLPMPKSSDDIGFGGVTPKLKKPIIAAINGFAVGGGCELALACDLIVIEEHALIGLTEVLRGVFAGAGGVQRLPRRIPPSIALEAILTGIPLTAQRAYEVGLANRLVPTGQGVEAALELAQSIAKAAPLAVALSKKVSRAIIHQGELEAMQSASEIRDIWWNSEDFKEGPLAFAEKREPVWKGR